MEHRAPPRLRAGTYRVTRTSGLIPPFLRKRTDGSTGWTCLGPLPFLAFRLQPRCGRVDLRYRRPLGFLVDHLSPAGPDVWDGHARCAGILYGRFRLEPVGFRPAPPPAPSRHEAGAGQEPTGNVSGR